MARFNEETPDDPSVKYFSYGAEFEPSWSNVFRVPWGVINEREGADEDERRRCRRADRLSPS